MLSIKKFFTQKKIWIKIILLFLLIIYFSFGCYRLEKFITVDEHYWINERIIQYWQAIYHQDWAKTFINDKPGVSLAYISGIGLFWEPHPDLYIKKFEKHVSTYTPADTLRLNFIFRLPLLLFNGFFIFLLFWLTKKVTQNNWVALLAASFILLSPILLGISRIVNPDSLLWNLSFAATLSFFHYLQAEEKKFALLTTLFLGLLLATKYTSTILFPFFFALIPLYFIYNFDSLNTNGMANNKFIKFILTYILICAGSFLFFAILMPYILIGEKYFYKDSIKTIYTGLQMIFYAILIFDLIIIFDKFALQNKFFNIFLRYATKIRRPLEIIIYSTLLSTTLFILINWLTHQGIINFDAVPFDIRKETEFTSLPFYQKFIIELYPVIFSLSPIILISLIYLWIKSIFQKIRYPFLTFSLSFFIIIYYILIISSNLLATIRYSIMIYPILMLLAAIGIWEFYSAYKNRFIQLPYILAIIIFSGIFSLWQNKPFYFNYTNSLLPQKYLITGSWGEGGYEAAEYLNSLPNAKNLTVWSDYSGVCEFFVGKCIKIYRFEKTKYDIDYYVLTRRGEILYNPDHKRWNKPNTVDAFKYYDKNNPVWSLNINDRSGNFIKIFKKNNL